jgi:hypothetical protein
MVIRLLVCRFICGQGQAVRARPLMSGRVKVYAGSWLWHIPAFVVVCRHTPKYRQTKQVAQLVLSVKCWIVAAGVRF